MFDFKFCPQGMSKNLASGLMTVLYDKSYHVDTRWTYCVLIHSFRFPAIFFVIYLFPPFHA